MMCSSHRYESLHKGKVGLKEAILGVGGGLGKSFRANESFGGEPSPKCVGLCHTDWERAFSKQRETGTKQCQ